MCGIAGFFNNDKLHPGLALEMVKKLRHRGPDNESYFNDGTISLGHARLNIIDNSPASNQPFHSNDGRYVMVYNGEVYNFRELAREMKYDPETTGDTEIVLECYRRYGADFVQRLNGMFAIAVYDKERKAWNFFRDRFGIKPLYYYSDGGNFAFASELKALTCLPFPKDLDLVALGDYLFLEYTPQPNTVLKDFRKLGNGMMLKSDGRNLEITPYYNLLTHLEDWTNMDEAIALGEFEELFDRSLTYRRISDVPVGAFLSGGSDSSAVCAGLSRQGATISAFNISFAEARYDESDYASKVASKLGLKLHSSSFGSGDLLALFDRIFSHFDEPFAVSSVFPTFKVSEMAKKEITVALSGDGGDELFMGYSHYRWYRRLRGMDGTAGRGMRRLMSGFGSLLPSRYERISRLLDYESIATDWPSIWSQEQYMFTEKEISQLTGKAYRNVGLRESWQAISNATEDPFLRISLFDIRHYLADDLMYKVDICSMANSLEVRLPFLDHKLVERSINFPSSLKITGNKQKYLLKKYLEKSLPPQLIYRKKWGFGAPIDQWLKKELKHVMDNYLDHARIKREGHFDPDFVRKLTTDFAKGKDFLYKRVWALIVFGIWRERFFRS